MGALPAAASFVQIAPREFVISAIKLAEEGEALVVRGYSISEDAIDVILRVWRRFTRAARVNLNEEGIAPLDLADGREVKLRVRPKEIVTIMFDV